jgi:seryl-tRNA synthetase
MPVEVFERTDYLASFPNLIGSISVFTGTDRDHAQLLAMHQAGEPWTDRLTASDLALQSASCHPLYPMATGRLAEGGRRFDILGYCFRHEPSLDPARMQSFRQHEYVYIGTPDEAVKHRDLWAERAGEILARLGLPFETVVANDPFFGRAGRMLAHSQLDDGLKLELVVPFYGDGPDDGVAVASSNCHRDHFGINFGIESADGNVAHSACVGFGMERITLALLRVHGTNPGTWAPDVRRVLSL